MCSSDLYTLDLTKPRGSRIYDVTIGGKPLDPAATYRICVNNYMASGGDGMNALKNAKGFRQDTGLVDLNVFVDYLGTHSPVRVTTEGRVRFIKN